MRTRRQAIDGNAEDDSKIDAASAAKRNKRSKGLVEADTGDAKSPKKENGKGSVAAKKSKRNANRDTIDTAEGPDRPQAADPIVPEQGDPVQNAKFAQKKAVKCKAAAATKLPAAAKASKAEADDARAEEQPKKRRRRAAAANEQATAADDAAAYADPAGVEGLETEADMEPVQADNAKQRSTVAGREGGPAQAQPAMLAAQDEDEEDDDEAPEEVSLAAGRAAAAAARRAEREMAAQQKRQAKEKGRRRAALAEAERDARLAAQQAEAAASGHLQAAAEEEMEEEFGEEDDLLPADVVAAIAARSREVAATQEEAAAELEPPAAAGKVLKKRRDPSHPKKVGPFLVQPLSRLPQNKPSEAAQEFARQRMFGRGVKRSAEMLVPSTARYYGPSLTFKV